AGAVYATLNAGQTDHSVKVDTAMVFLDQQQQQKPPEQQPVQLDVPLKGFQTVVAPDVIPTNIPPVNLQEKFDPKDYSGTGVKAASGPGSCRRAMKCSWKRSSRRSRPSSPVRNRSTPSCCDRRGYRGGSWSRRSSTRPAGPSRRRSRSLRAPTPASISRPRRTCSKRCSVRPGCTGGRCAC